MNARKKHEKQFMYFLKFRINIFKSILRKMLLLFGLNFFGPEAQMFVIQIYWKLPKDNLDCSHRNQTRQSTSHSL